MLSLTKVEYIAMSMAICDIIPLMARIKEMREGVQIRYIFEDNSGTLDLARLPQLHPCTKHINHMRKYLMKIFPIDVKDQIANTITKALAQTIS
eukprot:CCRYP_000172-RA/>CCRYP_000172-RA protein AED:0.44 eAED:0.44 QI:0/0/0/1/0/0/3/0/93